MDSAHAVASRPGRQARQVQASQIVGKRVGLDVLLLVDHLRIGVTGSAGLGLHKTVVAFNALQQERRFALTDLKQITESHHELLQY